MSLPYMPGWWDEISKNATNLAGQLPQMIQPDRVANKKLQEMVQQNPMLLEQFSNMDEGTRNMLAQSLGFKNQNPLAKLPVGQQRQDREALAAYKKNMTSEQAEIGMARAAGTDPIRDIARRGVKEKQEDEAFVTTLEGRVTDNKTGKIKLDVLEKEVARQEAYLSKAAPELAPMARAMAFGQTVPNEALQRVFADPVMKDAFEGYYKAFSMGREFDMRKTISSMKSPQEKLMAISWVEKELDNTRAQVAPLRNKVRGRDGFLTKMSDPAAYAADEAELSRLENRLKQIEDVFASEVEKLGGTKLPKNSMPLPITPPSLTPGPLANPTNRPPLGQIDASLFGKR